MCAACGQYTDDNVPDDTDSEGELDDSLMMEQEQKTHDGDLGSTTITELRQEYLLARRRFRKFSGRAPRHVRRPRHPFGRGRGSSGCFGGSGKGFGKSSGKGFGGGSLLSSAVSKGAPFPFALAGGKKGGQGHGNRLLWQDVFGPWGRQPNRQRWPADALS